MPYNRPSLPEIIERSQSDYDSRLPGTDARLRRANTAVLARVEGGVSHGLHGHLDWIARNMLLSTADDEEMIIQHCLEYGVARKAAAYAGGNVVITGAEGSVLPQGYQFQRADGVLYETTADAEIADGTAAVACTAVDPGADGNCGEGTSLTLLSPADGINFAAVVAIGGMAGGLDLEDIEKLRARGLRRKRLPPHSGAKHDYENWTLEIAGITRVWCLPLWTGDGHVGVTFVLDGEDGSVTLPNGAKLAEVEAYIASHIDPVTGELVEAPVNANVIVFAPTPVPLDPHITLTPDTAETRAAVVKELQDLLLREATAEGATIPLSRINEAISLAAGETDHELTSPVAPFTTVAGELAVLGDITWG